MQNWKRFPRVILFALLIIGLCAGLVAPRLEPAEAAPVRVVSVYAGQVVISEFRTIGPGGSNDEFIEIFNRSGDAVVMAGWTIYKSSGCGTTPTKLVTINTTLEAGQHYLIGKSPEYTGVVDQSYTSSVADNGGIALLEGSLVVDQVGMCDTTLYVEGASLSSLSKSVEQSYERKNLGCRDTDNNSTDFKLNASSSNPQTLADLPLPCVRVIDVTSSAGSPPAYTVGETIAITIKFNVIVKVTGAPTLLLETGLTDRVATYSGGSDSDTLTFTYIVVAGDTSADLDYVATDSLSLNGGTIVGAAGNAVLTLPIPGESGSLGGNRDIVINNQSAPSVLSFKRQDPLTTPTNADSLTFRVTFSEAVTGVDWADFVATGITGGTLATTPVNGSIYDVTISGGDLATFEGDVGLNLNSTQNIQDIDANPLPTSEPTVDETYTVDNTVPAVTIEQAAGQVDPAVITPVKFTVTFSEPIDVGSFATSDIKQTGIANYITWTIKDSGDHTIFTLSAVSVGTNGTLIPIIEANTVKDLAGNDNSASTGADNKVEYKDVVPPTVTINQSASQPDPTRALPIKFDVVFSEVINVSTFTTSDITQNGTATGVEWSLVDSGNHRAFTLTATSVGSVFGTLKPSIGANRVLDIVGNNNKKSEFNDNEVLYDIRPPTKTPTPTPTRTPTPSATRTVLINEIAWAGTAASSLDEWIELYNPGQKAIDLTGWKLYISDMHSSGAPATVVSLRSVLLQPGDYYVIARSVSAFRETGIVDQESSLDLSNSGEWLYLKDASGKEIDRANHEGNPWLAGSASPNYASMERNFSGIHTGKNAWTTYAFSRVVAHDRDGNSIKGTPGQGNWAYDVTNTPIAPTRVLRTPTPSLEGRVIINEILPRPGYDWNQDGRIDVFDEFIELKNIGTESIKLDGWKLDDENGKGSNSFTLPSITLKPGERVVYFGLETNILLSDGGDTARLVGPNGKEYDKFIYPVVKAEDESICRLPDGRGSWYQDCTPTPNLTNTREGLIPAMSNENYQSPVCSLPDTLPADFLFAECRGYGVNIWSAIFWDATGWQGKLVIPHRGKMESFLE